nr:MAG TPA: copper amine oxidase [Caudoviricetes sp.]
MFGMAVYWDEKNNRAILADEIHEISIKSNNCVLDVDDYFVEIDSVPEIKGGRMMAPIRPIAELVGYNVNFIDDTIIMGRII